MFSLFDVDNVNSCVQIHKQRCFRFPNRKSDVIIFATQLSENRPKVVPITYTSNWAHKNLSLNDISRLEHQYIKKDQLRALGIINA